MNKCCYLSTHSKALVIQLNTVKSQRQSNKTPQSITLNARLHMLEEELGTTWDLWDKWVDVSLIYIRFPGGFSLLTQ